MSISQAYENRGFGDDHALVPEVVEDDAGTESEAWETGEGEWGMNDLIEEEEEPLTEEEKTEFLENVTVIRDNLKAFYRVGMALKKIHDGRLYRERYVNFEEFCQEHLDLSRRYSYNLIDAAGVMENLCAIAHTSLPINEAQVRPLIRIRESEQQIAVWKLALGRAEEEGRKITAKLVEEVVNECLGIPEPEPAEDRAERERRLMEMVSEDYMEKHRAYLAYLEELSANGWKGCPREAVIAHLKLTINFVKGME